MEIHKITHVKHSGQGETATYIKVLDKFKESFETGKNYCLLRGWKVSKNQNIISVTSSALFGFELTFLATE